MRKNKGFTLVELLVVIGIIALLISILLPALNKARESAKVVTCASQMRQVALAARTYAADNKDALPPMAGDTAAAYYAVYSSSAETALAGLVNPNLPGGFAAPFARSIFWPYWVNGSTGAEYDNVPNRVGIGAGVGRLYTLKYLQGPFFKLIQCPSAYVGEERNEARNYGFNPHFAYRTRPGGTELLPQPWWRKMAGYGRANRTFTAIKTQDGSTVQNYSFGARRFALVTDAINFPNTGDQFGVVSHLSKSSYAVNLCFSDGSVQTAILPKTITRLGGQYGRFSDILGYLETSLEGGGTGSTWTAGKYGYAPVNP